MDLAYAKCAEAINRVVTGAYDLEPEEKRVAK